MEGSHGHVQRHPLLPILGLATAITCCGVAWGYLVWLAVDLGADARSGRGAAWGLLAISTIGAIAALFLGLILLVRLIRTLTRPQVKGGRRAAR